jgi:hypothetical protein
VQVKAPISTQSTGYADDADCTGKNLRLDHLVCIPIHRDNPGLPRVAPRQLRAPGRGARATAQAVDRPSDAAAGGIPESADMGLALTKWINYHGSNIFRSQRRISNEEKKRKRIKNEVYPHPRHPAYQDPRVLLCFQTLLHLRSSASVISSAHRVPVSSSPSL